MTRRILHLITSLEGGGTENFLFQILAHSPTGYTHEVVYLKKDGVIGDRIRRLNIPVHPAGSLAALFLSLRRNPPTILHTCLYRAHILGRILGALSGIKGVVTSQRAIDSWQKPLHTALDRWTLPLSQAVMVNSRAAEKLIQMRRGSRQRPVIHVIPNGVDMTRFQPQDASRLRQRYGLPATARVGGTLMRLHAEKGADLIPEFAAQLLRRFPELHLLIGGTGPLESSIHQQIAPLPFAERIHFTGWENDTAGFLSACDFFWSLSREESFPQSLVEASAIGLSWVAPDTGGIPELIAAGAAGRTFPRLDIAAAVEVTSTLLKEWDAAHALAHERRSRIQDAYALPEMINRVYGVFAHF